MTPMFICLAMTAAIADDAKKPTGPPSGQAIPAAPLLVQGRALGVADRPGEVKQAWESYQRLCVRFVEALSRAKSETEKADLMKRPPSPGPMAYRLAQLVTANPKDDAAFEALALLVQYADMPMVSQMLTQLSQAPSGSKTAKRFDPWVLLLDHHIHHPKLGMLIENLPRTEATRSFVMSVYEKSASQQARGLAGYRLASEAKESGDEATAESILTALAADRYMDGVKVPVSGYTVKDWAERELNEIRLLGIGKAIPDVRVQGLDGKTHSVAEYRGQVVVLDVWATWCGPCRAMIPHQREMVKKWDGKPFTLISVSCDEELETLKDFLQETEMPWVHWWAGKQGEFSKAMNIRFYPTIYVIDAKGIIRFKNIRGDKLEEAVSQLLAELE